MTNPACPAAPRPHPATRRPPSAAVFGLGLVVLMGVLAPLLAASDPPAATAPARDPAVERAVIDAVRFAYGLEQAYWDNPARWPTWEQLNAHYRQGFSAELARSMTDYSRSGDDEPATWVPDEVRVASIDGDTALVWFPTPPAFGHDGAWGFDAYMVLRLRREASGHWVVFWGTDSATPP